MISAVAMPRCFKCGAPATCVVPLDGFGKSGAVANYCAVCSGVCLESPTFAPYPSHLPPGCQPLKQLTEADVRRIVREELNKETHNG